MEHHATTSANHPLYQHQNNVVSLQSLQAFMSHGGQRAHLLLASTRLTTLAGSLLHLPQTVIACAQVLLARFHTSQDMSTRIQHQASKSQHTCSSVHILGAALLVATKVEEVPRSIRDIINVIHALTYCWYTNPSLLVDPSSSTNQAPLLLVGSELYYSLRQGLLAAETQLLVTLGFHLDIQFPYGFAIHYIQSLGLMDTYPRMVQLAWNYLNDSYHTLMHVIYQPHVIAVAVVDLAARRLGISLPLAPTPWYDIFDADEQDLCIVEAHIMNVYSQTVMLDLPLFELAEMKSR